MIIDMADIGMTEIPITPLKNFLASAENNFKGRTHKIFILNTSYIIRASFSVFLKMVDEFTGQKINMLGKDY